ncbi:hypothetical protein C8J56DRAFT_909019 [Mycena floridula]|nr:hypothetical protein C8J56DRAFT_909019 [Mycena floridula]
MLFTQVVLLATIVASVAAAPYSYLESRDVSAYELAERDLDYEFESRDLEARRYTQVKINVLGTASSSTIKEAHKIMEQEWKASKGLQEFDTCDVTFGKNGPPYAQYRCYDKLNKIGQGGAMAVHK